MAARVGQPDAWQHKWTFGTGAFIVGSLVGGGTCRGWAEEIVVVPMPLPQRANVTFLILSQTLLRIFI